MESHSLESLGAEYGETLVSLETFSRLLGEAPGRIRARRAHDSDFPTPVTLGSTQDYRLSDLIEWVSSPATRGESARPLIVDPDPDDLNRFALDAAVRQCAAAHGAEGTLRFAGGVALNLAAGWRPALRHSPAELVREIRAASLPDWDPPIATDVLRRGFTPDPHPGRDWSVRSSTLDWYPPGATPKETAIPRVSVEAGTMIIELLRLWSSMSGGFRHSEFAAEIDALISPLASLENRGASISQPIVYEVLSRLGGVKPGDLVCDPACGEASALISMVEQTDARGLQTIGVEARDMNERVWVTAKIRLGVRNIAHRLGAPGRSSLDPTEITGSFDVVVIDPGRAQRQLSEWFALAMRLTSDIGTAVVAMPSSVFERPFELPSWWTSLDEKVKALVRIPGSMRSGSRDVHACVLTHSPTPNVLVVDAGRMRLPRELLAPLSLVRRAPQRSSFADEPPTIIEFSRIITDEVARWIDTSGPTEKFEDENLTIERVDGIREAAALQSLTLRNVGESRPTRAMREQRERARLSAEAEAGLVIPGSPVILAILDGRNPIAIPDVFQGDLRLDEDSIDRRREAIRLALESLGRLRWLIDEASESVGSLDESLHGELHDGTTEEMRRALRRLEQRLTGKETRGRGSRPAPGQADSEA